MIDQPGIYEIPADEYFAHPALSASGAKKLLPPSCPAIFKWEQDNPPASSDAFDFGHAAHKLVLGEGETIVEVEAKDWRTKNAQEAQQKAYYEGRIPLLSKDLRKAEAMAKVVSEHPMASTLFDPAFGLPEQSLFWQEDIWRKRRLDWLPEPIDGRMILADYKTSASANPEAFRKSAGNFGYYMDAAWSIDAVKALGLCEDAAFIMVVQEKTAPYLITVVELDADALRLGREQNERAIQTYIRCMDSDTWPSYSDDVVLLSLPRWFESNLEEAS